MWAKSCKCQLYICNVMCKSFVEFKALPRQELLDHTQRAAPTFKDAWMRKALNGEDDRAASAAASAAPAVPAKPTAETGRVGAC